VGNAQIKDAAAKKNLDGSGKKIKILWLFVVRGAIPGIR
jgi:hypothetical protein